jgi:hypothetical protein
MTTITDMPSHHAMAVHDGKRCVCVARHYRGAGWLLHLKDGACWFPRRGGINRLTGRPHDPSYLPVKTKSEARKLLASLK